MSTKEQLLACKKNDALRVALRIVDSKVRGNREAFPSSTGCFMQIVQALGDLAALNGTGTPSDVRDMALTLAAIAVRYAADGDASVDTFRHELGLGITVPAPCVI